MKPENAFVSWDDKKEMLRCLKVVKGILGKYDNESEANELIADVDQLHHNLDLLKVKIEDGRDLICFVTDKPISGIECNVCETRSCPINTGFAEGPRPINK